MGCFFKISKPTALSLGKCNVTHWNQWNAYIIYLQIEAAEFTTHQ